MALLNRLLSPQVGERRSSMADILKAMGAGSATRAGVSVTPDSALNYTAVLAGVRILAESVASLPALVYERSGDGRRRASGHGLYGLLHDAPNRRQTSFEFFELGMAHLVLWGNFYAEIERNGRGQVLALWPLRPDRMTVDVAPDGRRVYRYANEPVADEAILHVAGLGGDGVTGYSLIRLAREAVGLGLATQEFGATVFANGAVPGIVLKHPGTLSDKAYNRVKESWNERHMGLANAHKAAILEEGMGVDKIGIPPEDAQFLETRRFQVEEIARILRIPPHMMAMTDKAATYASVEQFAIQFVRDTIRPWLKRWEAALGLQLMDGAERQRFYIEFLVDDLLRGDTQTRYQAYATGRQWGWLSANDIRRLENLDRIDGGDGYMMPLNMGEMGKGDGRRWTRPSAARPSTAGSDRVGRVGRVGRGGGLGLSGAAGGDGNGPKGGGGTTEVVTTAAERRADEAVARGRQRIGEVARPQLAEAAQRIVNREFNDVGAAAKSLLGKRGRAEFDEWLNQFATDHAAFVEKQMRGPVTAAAALAADSAAQEIGAEAAPDVSEFVEDYLASRAAMWVANMRADVRAAVYPAGEDEATDYDALAAVQERLQKRKEEEAEDWARDQSVRVVNAVAVVAWGLLGWLALRWVVFGKNCDFCGGLNGRTVGISSWFALAGEAIEGAEGEAPLKPGSNVRHPPLHRGCDCMVVPG